jgi:AcrR family transcriptional regulator
MRSPPTLVWARGERAAVFPTMRTLARPSERAWRDSSSSSGSAGENSSRAEGRHRKADDRPSRAHAPTVLGEDFDVVRILFDPRHHLAELDPGTQHARQAQGQLLRAPDDPGTERVAKAGKQSAGTTSEPEKVEHRDPVRRLGHRADKDHLDQLSGPSSHVGAIEPVREGDGIKRRSDGCQPRLLDRKPASEPRHPSEDPAHLEHLGWLERREVADLVLSAQVPARTAGELAGRLELQAKALRECLHPVVAGSDVLGAEVGGSARDFPRPRAPANPRSRLEDGHADAPGREPFRRGQAGEAGADHDHVLRLVVHNLGSIGYHFGSKDALLNEAVILGFRNWTEHLARRARAVEAGNPLERLRLSWEAMSAELDEQEGLLQAFLEALAPASRSPELRAQLAGFYREAREEVATIVGESLGEDREAKAAAMIIASLLIAVFDGLQLQWLLEPEQTPSADEIGKAVGRALSAALR